MVVHEHTKKIIWNIVDGCSDYGPGSGEAGCALLDFAPQVEHNGAICNQKAGF